MAIITFLLGICIAAAFRILISGFYTVRPDERAVITSFGRAQRLNENVLTDPSLTEDEQERYQYPMLNVIPAGGPYFKWPWQTVHKVTVSTQSVDLTWDPTKAQETVESVTKDNLTTGVNGQIRFRASESNLYPYLFGVTSPLEHVMGFFVSVLRERIANFVDPRGNTLVATDEADEANDKAGIPIGTSIELSEGVSINDLRKNLPLLNEYMEQQCKNTAGRYGIELDAALITEIDPPPQVDHALSAINSTRNQVAADISTARADAEQQITMSKRAVEIASNTAEAEIAPLNEMSTTLVEIKQQGGSEALRAYLRNMRIPLLERTTRIISTQN